MPYNVISERLVLGTLPFLKLSEKQCFDILDRFFYHGGCLIDTANMYGLGKVEKCINKYLKLYKPNVKISTKIGYFNNESDYHNVALIKEKILYSLEHNSCLKYILLHEADWATWWNSTSKKGELWNESDVKNKYNIYFECKDFVNNLSINIGLSGNNARPLHLLSKILNPDLILVAKQYDLLWRNALPLIDNAKINNYKVWCGAPFHQGWLFKLNQLKKKVPFLEPNIIRLQKHLVNNSTSIEEIAIRFILDTTNTNVVFGVKSITELDTVFKNANRVFDISLINTLKKIDTYCFPMQGPINI